MKKNIKKYILLEVVEEKAVGGYDEWGLPWCWGCWNELLSAIGGYDDDDLEEEDTDGICL